jgi:hypothetical protein
MTPAAPASKFNTRWGIAADPVGADWLIHGNQRPSLGWSCGEPVAVMKAAEDGASDESSARTARRGDQRRVVGGRRLALADPLVWPGVVEEEVAVLVEHSLQVRLVVHEDMVDAFAPDGADESLHVAIWQSGRSGAWSSEERITTGPSRSAAPRSPRSSTACSSPRISAHRGHPWTAAFI